MISQSLLISGAQSCTAAMAFLGSASCRGHVLLMTKPQSCSALSFVAPPAPKASRAQGICWNQLKPSNGNLFGALTPPSKPPLFPPLHPILSKQILGLLGGKRTPTLARGPRSQGSGLPQPREGGGWATCPGWLEAACPVTKKPFP